MITHNISDPVRGCRSRRGVQGKPRCMRVFCTAIEQVSHRSQLWKHRSADAEVFQEGKLIILFFFFRFTMLMSFRSIVKSPSTNTLVSLEVHSPEWPPLQSRTHCPRR